MKEFLDIIKIIGVCILGILIVTILVGAICTPLLTLECNAQAKDIGLSYKYDFWGGCLVQENGYWMPLDNWRYIGNK